MKRREFLKWIPFVPAAGVAIAKEPVVGEESHAMSRSEILPHAHSAPDMSVFAHPTNERELEKLLSNYSTDKSGNW